MKTHQGSCHCGAVRLQFETSLNPEDIEVRACQCSFCIKHGSCAVADPKGRLIISVQDASQLKHYRFGLRTADYLLCASCGVYVAAVTTDDEEPRAVVVINVLDDRDLFNRDPVAVDFDAEDKVVRVARHRERWMLVSVEIG
jgi:hypothetical protein